MLHYGHAIYMKKYHKAKERRIYGNSNISPCKNIIIKKSSKKKRNQNPSRYYYNSLTNLKFQHKPKYISSFKNPHIKIIDLLFIIIT